jgi:cytochrome c oxidase subunit II
MNPIQGVDQAFWYILSLSALLLISMTAVMIYFVIRYRRSRHPDSVDIRGNWILEVVWTVVPTILALSMFWVGWSSYTGLRNVPPGALEIDCFAQMFSWIFVYDNDKETENELVVPENTPVKINVTSLDVIHGLYIPAFRVKVDAVKNMPTYVWFRTGEQGSFDIFCTEYCGTGHSSMHGKVRVVSQSEYTKWLEENGDE